MAFRKQFKKSGSFLWTYMSPYSFRKKLCLNSPLGIIHRHKSSCINSVDQSRSTRLLFLAFNLYEQFLSLFSTSASIKKWQQETSGQQLSSFDSLLLETDNSVVFPIGRIS